MNNYLVEDELTKSVREFCSQIDEKQFIKESKKDKDARKTWGHNFPHSEKTKKLLSEINKGNTNAKGKTWSNPESHKIASRKRMLTEANPMSSPESVDKIRQKALIKHPCPNCGKKMNKGNLSRHIKLCTKYNCH